MAKRIFKDPEHQAVFDKQGFIVLPFLTAAEVSLMDTLFNELRQLQQRLGIQAKSQCSHCACL